MPKKPTEVSGRFGKLTVIHCNLPPRKRVLVRCDCGKEFATRSYDLINGRVRSCGSSECSSRSLDLIGERFGLLTVRALSQSKNHRQELIWICDCDCGKTRRVKTNNLTHGFVKSCGCQKDILRAKSLLKPIDDVAVTSIWTQYKYGAKKRNLDFHLTKEDVKSFIFSNCHYCNSPPIGIFVAKSIVENRDIKYNGIDRIDSGLGYTVENCVSCCKICNVAKSDIPLSDFLQWAHNLVQYQMSQGCEF